MTVSIIDYINGLGKRWRVLAENGTLTNQRPVGLYAGAQVLCLFPVTGVALEFDLEDEILQRVHVITQASELRGPSYQGALPGDLDGVCNKAEVRAKLGKAVKEVGPVKLSEPVGMVGGWDGFHYAMKDGEVLFLMVRYTLSDSVESITFEKARALQH
ncbi:DUF6392 family protein [Pseudomonas eucalypticola]|uniref:Pyocin immunity protein n=1 Tax=Pseudomonas eucalypticola TaxID=2599595 RepID=A0A7D5H3P9_9PSED|nr:DUF6392 family protein [Pseudomonas eucalypticola]QKZ03109.1 hypothetical protein HWQ56_04625 [Pseudomonas eucalypticola]